MPYTTYHDWSMSPLQPTHNPQLFCGGGLVLHLAGGLLVIQCLDHPPPAAAKRLHGESSVWATSGGQAATGGPAIVMRIRGRCHCSSSSSNNSVGMCVVRHVCSCVFGALSMRCFCCVAADVATAADTAATAAAAAIVVDAANNGSRGRAAASAAAVAAPIAVPAEAATSAAAAMIATAAADGCSASINNMRNSNSRSSSCHGCSCRGSGNSRSNNHKRLWSCVADPKMNVVCPSFLFSCVVVRCPFPFVPRCCPCSVLRNRKWKHARGVCPLSPYDGYLSLESSWHDGNIQQAAQ